MILEARQDPTRTTHPLHYTSTEIRTLLILPDDLPALQQRETEIRLVLAQLDEEIIRMQGQLSLRRSQPTLDADWERRVLQVRRIALYYSEQLQRALKRANMRLTLAEQRALAEATTAARHAASLERIAVASQEQEGKNAAFVRQAKLGLPRETYLGLWAAVEDAQEERETNADAQ